MLNSKYVIFAKKIETTLTYYMWNTCYNSFYITPPPHPLSFKKNPIFFFFSVSCYEHWILLNSDSYNVQHKLFTSKTCGRTFYLIEDFGHLHSLDYIKYLVQSFSHIVALDLNIDEKCILSAISILSAGRGLDLLLFLSLVC